MHSSYHQPCNVLLLINVVCLVLTTLLVDCEAMYHCRNRSTPHADQTGVKRHKQAACAHRVHCLHVLPKLVRAWRAGLRCRVPHAAQPAAVPLRTASSTSRQQHQRAAAVRTSTRPCHSIHTPAAAAAAAPRSPPPALLARLDLQVPAAHGAVPLALGLLRQPHALEVEPLDGALGVVAAHHLPRRRLVADAVRRLVLDGRQPTGCSCGQHKRVRVA